MEETPPHKLFTLIWLFTHFNLIENKVSWHQVIEDALVVALDEISARLKQENGGPRHALLGFITIFSLSIFWGQVSSQFRPFLSRFAPCNKCEETFKTKDTRRPTSTPHISDDWPLLGGLNESQNRNIILDKHRSRNPQIRPILAVIWILVIVVCTQRPVWYDKMTVWALFHVRLA